MTLYYRLKKKQKTGRKVILLMTTENMSLKCQEAQLFYSVGRNVLELQTGLKRQEVYIN